MSKSQRPRRRAPKVVKESRPLSAMWKVGVAVVGGLVLLAGVIMLVTPGPAFVLIPAGLAILATEFKWAKRWFHKARDAAHRAREKARNTSTLRKVVVFVLGAAAAAATAAAWVWCFGWPDLALSAWGAAHDAAGWLPAPPTD